METSPVNPPGTDPRELVRLHFRALETGDPVLTRRLVAPEHVNWMAADEPPACALRGPAGFLATGAWLRGAFAELAWEEVATHVDGDWVAARVRMRGVHRGPFVVFPPGGKPEVFPPTGRAIAVAQAHFFRMRERLSIEHVAVRDDLGMMTQLGFLPPGPGVALRLAFFHLSGRARRAVAEVVEQAAQAAGGADE